MIVHLLPLCKEQTITSTKASKVLLYYVDLARIKSWFCNLDATMGHRWSGKKWSTQL